MDRFVVDAYGVDVEAERVAVRWLVNEATARRGDAAIVVPTMSSLEGLERVFGADRVSRAKRTRVLTVDGVTIHLLLRRTLPARFDGPVLVPWADTLMVERAERLRPPAVCATGWSPGGLDDWKRAWSPIDLRTGEPESIADEPPAAVVGAVASLSGAPASDVLHPSDKRRAINVLKALRINGVAIDPVVVRGLALKNGWQPSAASRLHELARKVSEGRTVQGGDRITITQARQLCERFERDQDVPR